MKDLIVKIEIDTRALNKALAELGPGNTERLRAWSKGVMPIMGAVGSAYTDLGGDIAWDRVCKNSDLDRYAPFNASDYARWAADLDEQMKAIVPPTPWYVLVKRELAMWWGWVVDMVIHPLCWWRP